MSKQLLLIRHAEAESESNAFQDFERELTGTGFANACKAGKKLHESGFKAARIFSSAAVRAFTTAKLIAEQLGYPESDIESEHELYNSSPRTLLEFINRIGNQYDCVILVNHNPGITYIAEYLTGSAIGGMVPCGIASITFDADDWALVSQKSGTLQWYREPGEN